MRKQTNFKNGQQIWTDISPIKMHRWQINVWKDAQNHVISELQIKNNEIPLHTYWIAKIKNKNKTKIWQYQMLAWMWSNRNSHSLLMWMPDGISTLEDSLAVSYKAKHSLTICSSHHILRYLPIWIKNLSLHKNLDTNIYNSHEKRQKGKVAKKMSFNRWMDEQTVVHLYCGIFHYINKLATIWYSSSAPGYICGKDENTNSKRYMHPSVHSSSIYNNQDMAALSSQLFCKSKTVLKSQVYWQKKLYYKISNDNVLTIRSLQAS